MDHSEGLKGPVAFPTFLPNRKGRRALRAYEKKLMRRVRKLLRNRKPGDIVELPGGHLAEVLGPEGAE